MTTRPAAGMTRRRLIFLCGLIPVLITSALALYRPGFLARLDDGVYDTLMRAARPNPPGNGVVIVDVDEQSLSAIGQWPWRRDVIARLIARLRAAGASIVALDIIFPETDRYAGQPASTPGGDVELTAPDAVLADTLRQGGVIVAYAMTFDQARNAGGCVLHALGLVMLESREGTGAAPYFRATGAVCSLPALTTAAGASGFLNAAPDSDGILRRAPLIVEYDGRVYPSLALAAVAASTGARDVALRTANVNASSLLVDRRTVPLDGKGNLLLRYRGKKHTFPYVSAADVLNGQVPDESLRGKIAFVGTTALGTREVVATPLDTLFAGVEVQATVADNLLQEDFVRRSQLGTTLESQAALALGLAIALLVARTGIVTGIFGSAAGAAALWYGAVSLLSTNGVFVSPLAPTIGVIAALGAMTFAKSTVEHQRAETAGRDKTNAQHLMVQTLLSLTETRDAETGRHSRRTQQYARLLADRLSSHPGFRAFLTPERIELLSSLAPLHDIGKVGIPDHILNKPSALTPDEIAEMRKHPALGRDVILKAEQEAGVGDDAILAMAKDIVYTHHERWDGTGYPQGLSSTEIPIPGRLMAVVDVYDAAVARSLYRPTISHEQAVSLIVAGRGTHFDPAVVDAFVSVAPVLKIVAQGEIR